MQYVTFLGVGGKDGYAEVEYYFDSPEESIRSKFVQESILRKYQKEIDDIIIISTEESQKMNKQELLQIIQNMGMGSKVCFKTIQKTITFEETVSILDDLIKGDFMIDVTHSFRDIPMTVLLSLQYMENAHQCNVEHLFYGKGFIDTPYQIVDFIDDYHMSLIGNELQQFLQTLHLNMDAIKDTYEKDDRIHSLLEQIDKFNRMIELCEMEKALKIIRDIIKRCQDIFTIKKYKLIHPFIKNIKDLFEPIFKSDNAYIQVNELIRILIEHKLFQNAITFTDELIREDIITLTMRPKNRKLNIQNKLFDERTLAKKNTVYDVSQYLISDVYKIRPNTCPSGNSGCFRYFEEYYNENIFNLNKSIDTLYRTSISSFYKDIRNHVNHATPIDLSVDRIKELLISVLDNLKRMRSLVDEK